MRAVTVVLFLSGLALVSGCTDEDATGPDDGDTYEFEASETIGPGGGTLAIEDFSLDVPAGAFDADCGLELYSSTEDQPFGEDGASRAFRVGGLPAEFLQPLRIAIKYDGPPSAGSFVAVGEEVFARSLADMAIPYTLCPAADSSGYLVTSLPATQLAGGSTGFRGSPLSPAVSDQALTFVAVTEQDSLRSQNGHFLIAFPVTADRGDVEALAGFLEEAYDDIRDGLGFDYSARTRWPVDVTVKDLKEGVFGYSASSFRGDNYGYLEFNTKEIDNREATRLTAGHEFFHLVQAFYDPRNWLSKATLAALHLWLDEATAVWSEALFTDQANYIPVTYQDNNLEPFEGMQEDPSGGGKNAQNHGYGMAAVIRYLTGRYGDDAVVRAYEALRGGAHPVEALSSGTEDPTGWLEGFFRDYILGNIYNMTVGFWRQNPHGSFTIDDAGDTLQTFSYSYPDLSARLYEIRLEDAGMDTSARLAFSLSGGDKDEVTVFRYRQTTIEYLDNDLERVTIPNVRNELVDNGWHLFALVTNSVHVSPYTGTTPIDLQVRLQEQTPPPEYTICGVEFLFMATMRTVNTDPETTYVEDYSQEFSNSGEGGFSGNTFTGTWDYEAGQGNHAGTVTVTLDETHQTVVTVQVQGSSDWDIGFTADWDFSAANIPVSNYWEGYREFSIEGEETCDHVTSVSYEYHANNITRTLLDYYSPDWSHLTVTFWED